MGNFIGKALIEAKKVGEVISKASTEIGAAVGEATKTISISAKRAAKISMLKAEIEGMYKDLGEAVFNDGLLLTNEKALDLMNVMMEKYKEIMALEEEEKAEKVANETSETDVTPDIDWDFAKDISFGTDSEEVEEDVESEVAEEKKVEEVKEVKKSAKKSSTKSSKSTKKEDK